MSKSLHQPAKTGALPSGFKLPNRGKNIARKGKGKNGIADQPRFIEPTATSYIFWG